MPFTNRKNPQSTYQIFFLCFSLVLPSDLSPVLVLQFHGSGNGLQRGTGSGVDEVWLVWVDDVKGSQRVVGRDQKRALYPKRIVLLWIAWSDCFPPATNLNTCIPSFDCFVFWSEKTILAGRTMVSVAWVTFVSISEKWNFHLLNYYCSELVIFCSFSIRQTMVRYMVR